MTVLMTGTEEMGGGEKEQEGSGRRILLVIFGNQNPESPEFISSEGTDLTSDEKHWKGVCELKVAQSKTGGGRNVSTHRNQQPTHLQRCEDGWSPTHTRCPRTRSTDSHATLTQPHAV